MENKATVMMTAEIIFVEKDLDQKKLDTMITFSKEDGAEVIKKMLDADQVVVTSKKVFIGEEKADG